MDLSDRRGLKSAAKESLSAASYDPKRLILIHTGAVLLLSLVMTVIDYLLQQQIAGTGGLSGLGLRSVLSTAQSMLQIVQTVLLPFWEIGLVAAAMKISRGQSATPDTLLTGFRRFGPVLRLELLRGLIILGIMIAACYVATLLFLLTPLSDPVLTALEPLMTTNAALDPMQMMEAVDPAALIPMYAITAVMFCLLVLPVVYSYRMADYILMDNPKNGALFALSLSRKMLRGKRMALFKLDLSFWWYYVLEGLTLAVCYGDLILPLIGIQLPVSSTVSFFLFFLLYLLCTLALRYFARDQIVTTYAKAYSALLKAMQPHPSPSQTPQPWNPNNNV